MCADWPRAWCCTNVGVPRVPIASASVACSTTAIMMEFNVWHVGQSALLSARLGSAQLV